MKSKLAQSIGSQYALQAVVVTSLIIFLIVATFLASATKSLVRVYMFFRAIGFINFSVFIGAALLVAMLLGNQAGKAMLISNKNFLWIGFKQRFL